MIPRILEVASDRAGSVIVEFAAVLPVLLLVLVGVLQFGLFFYQYTALTAATVAGARQFSVSRLDPNAATDTENAIKDASCNWSATSCNLDTANLTITLSVNGTQCNSSSNAATNNTTCQNALAAANTYNTTATSSLQAITVTVSYACNLLMPTGWVNLTGICPLSLTLAQLPQ